MPTTSLRAKLSCAFAATASVALGGCATMPGAGIPAGSPITPAEAAQGAEYHPQFLSEFGGEVEGIQSVYVEGIGDAIAVQSGLAATPEAFEVTLLNSAAANAFAIPGGYIYVTRQLAGLLNSEAELAAVLAHEVGHVAARHSARRQTTAQRNQLLGILGQVLSTVVLGDSALGQLGRELSTSVPQLATLSYSREQELEADALAIAYLRDAGYDPTALADALQSLAAQNALDAQIQGRDAQMPEWASTHPNPAGRIQNALRLAAGQTGVDEEGAYLTRIGGLMWDDDPEQGIIEGMTFVHPILRLAFEAPQDHFLLNGTQAVSINGPAGRGQFTSAPYGGNLESYVGQVFAAIGGQQSQLRPQTIERTTVNGLRAAYGIARVTGGEAPIDVVVFAYEFSNDQAFHFATVTPAGRSGVFTPMFNSLRRISAAQAAQVVPRRIEIVTVQRGDTVQSLAQRMAYSDWQVERFRVLNGLQSTDVLVPGERVKVVVRSDRL